MRYPLAILCVALALGVARSDALPDPPPKGRKVVQVTSEVMLAKGVTGYVFVRDFGEYSGREGVSSTQSWLDLDEKDATEIAKGGHHKSFARVYAIPETTANKFDTNRELLNAVKDKQLKDSHFFSVARQATVSDKVKGKVVTWTYTITGIDEKEGIKVEIKGEGYEKPADKKDEKKPLALAEPGTLIGGIAAALAVTLGGLWLVGRKKAA